MGLGALVRVPTPVTAACVVLADALCGRPWARDGRTMDRLGLAGLRPEDIRGRFVG